MSVEKFQKDTHLVSFGTIAPVAPSFPIPSVTGGCGKTREIFLEIKGLKKKAHKIKSSIQ
jgi:hypothetical protein